MLDLNALENPVWNRTQSFYGVPFALCMLHNFGERPGLFGRLPNAATAPPLALAESAPGTLVGTGMTPEGINTNPIVYRLRVISIQTEILSWLRFTYVVESWCAE